MTIRPLMPDEALRLLAVFESSVRGLACRDYTREQIDAWIRFATGGASCEAWTARIASNRPWVAELDGRIAGFADVQPSGHIDQFFVAAEYAGRGVGTALMRHLHDVAQVSGTKTLSSHVSLSAQPFFQRCGFTVVQRQQVVLGNVTLSNAVMCKTLM